MRRYLLGTLLIGVLGAAPVLAQGLAGTYVLNAPDVTLTLVLRQDSAGHIGGTLSSTAGIQYQVDGMLQGGVGVGTCYNDEGAVYFEAHPQGRHLGFTLIEPGADNMPDYTRTQTLAFVRRDAGPTEAPSDVSSGTGSTVAPAGDSESGLRAGSAAEEIGDPAWGFTVQTPPGWKAQKTSDGVVLGHDEIAGMILILPHTVSGMQEVRSQMRTGLSEEGLQLYLSGTLGALSDNALAGDYSGIAQGQQVTARGIGTLSPYGGGAYIIALTTPEQYGPRIKAAAETLAGGIRYTPVKTSNLAQIFVGTWVTVTRNTMTSVTLYPDGTYSESYEAGYGGQFTNQYGDLTGNWATAGEDRDRGRWTARGGERQGVIVLMPAGGGQEAVQYRVHVENGHTYWREYWFDGELYRKQ